MHSVGLHTMATLRHVKALLWVAAIAVSMVALSACDNRDDGDTETVVQEGGRASGTSTSYHQGEWATIQGLDPRGEGCVDCHGEGEDEDIAEEHSLNPEQRSLYEEDPVITEAAIDSGDGELRIQLDKDPTAGKDAFEIAESGISVTFAQLSPRARLHEVFTGPGSTPGAEPGNGYDWQNYHNEVAGDGVEPEEIALSSDNVELNGNHEIVVSNLGEEIGWTSGDLSFEVNATDGETYSFSGHSGVKVEKEGEGTLADDIRCDVIEDPIGNGTDGTQASRQVASEDGSKLVCQWPDGTVLPAGTFITSNGDLVVLHQENQTQRVALLVQGEHEEEGYEIGYNTAFDFVPQTGDRSFDWVDNETGEIVHQEYDVKEDGPASVGDPGSGEVTVADPRPAARNIVTAGSCNSCHDDFGELVHGVDRADPATCVTCHNPGNLETPSGHSLDFKQLVHRIHRGSNLPHANDNSDDGGTPSVNLVDTFEEDWTAVNFPQGPTPGRHEGVSNCVKCHMGGESEDVLTSLAKEIGRSNNDQETNLDPGKGALSDLQRGRLPGLPRRYLLAHGYGRACRQWR